jgi:hypothetical protein
MFIILSIKKNLGDKGNELDENVEEKNLWVNNLGIIRCSPL